MTTALIVAVAILAVGLVWLGLALVGAVRELSELRERVARLETQDEHGPLVLPGRLPIGAREPAWEVVRPDGSVASSAALRGTRHLVVVADADCRACDGLVPAVVAAAAADTLLPTVVVGRGEPGAIPVAWRPDPASRGTVIVGCEHDDEVGRAFGTDLSPHVFVIDEGGSVAAQGGALSLEEVRDLVAEAEPIRIVAGRDA
jgi:hypothetical protein